MPLIPLPQSTTVYGPAQWRNDAVSLALLYKERTLVQMLSAPRQIPVSFQATLISKATLRGDGLKGKAELKPIISAHNRCTECVHVPQALSPCLDPRPLHLAVKLSRAASTSAVAVRAKGQ